MARSGYLPKRPGKSPIAGPGDRFWLWSSLWPPSLLPLLGSGQLSDPEPPIRLLHNAAALTDPRQFQRGAGHLDIHQGSLPSSPYTTSFLLPLLVPLLLPVCLSLISGRAAAHAFVPVGIFLACAKEQQAARARRSWQAGTDQRKRAVSSWPAFMLLLYRRTWHDSIKQKEGIKKTKGPFIRSFC